MQSSRHRINASRDRGDSPRLPRRRVLRTLACGAAAGCALALGGCHRRRPQTTIARDDASKAARRRSAPRYPLAQEEIRTGALPEHRGRKPTTAAEVRIDGLGILAFQPSEVETVRPDIFRPGHFALFDILIHLQRTSDLDLAYHYDEALDTHVIDRLNGQPNWWYQAHYADGWFERNVTRMDMYPYKDGTKLWVSPSSTESMSPILESFGAEVERRRRHSGKVLLPEVRIETPKATLEFSDVLVRSHDLRSDLYQPGIVTAMDIILSLVETGGLSDVGLTWYERIAGADPVDSYFLEEVNAAEASGGCGLVYEVGPRAYEGFRGAHIHIPSDARALVSPEYALWYWICLGGAGL